MRYALFLLASAAALAQTATVSGRVLTLEGTPIANAVVHVDVHRVASYEELTDPQGRFTFNLAPGEAYFEASRAGYFRPYDNYGVNMGHRPLLRLAAGDAKRLDIHLQPAGVISGVVTDADGEPMPNVPLVLEHPGTPGNVIGFVGGTNVSTDDRGQFRISGVPAGSYYLQAARDPQRPPAAPSGMEKFHLPTYYSRTKSGVTNSAEATVLDIHGQALEGLKIRMVRGRGYAIRGRATNPSNAPLYPILTPITGFPFESRRGSSSNSSDFVLVDVAPGDYTLLVRVAVAERLSSNGPDRSEIQYGLIPVQIRDRDVDVEVSVKPGDLTLSFTAADSALPTQDLQSGFGAYFGRQSLYAGPDGTIMTRALAPGVYSPDLRLYPDGYIKAARLNGRDVLQGASLDLHEGGPWKLELAISKRAGRINLKPAAGEKPYGLFGVWPAKLTIDHGRRRDFVRYPALINSTRETIELTQLPPGDYYLVEWETPPPQSLATRADFLERFRSAAQKVTVRESGTVTASPKLVRRKAIEQAVKELEK